MRFSRSLQSRVCALHRIAIRKLCVGETVFYDDDEKSHAQYPNRYPPNTTCAYILDGLQGDQDLEKVILEFEQVSLLLASNDADGSAKSPSRLRLQHSYLEP